MQYKISLVGIAPIIMHCGLRGLETRSSISLEIKEISKKRGSNRTETDDQRLAELECQRSFWLDPKGKVEIPARVIRANIETGARKLKQGPQVREGLVVTGTEFNYDTELYGTTLEELGKSAQFTTAVVVQRNRILRTRGMFKDWSVIVFVDTDPELVDKIQLSQWLDIGGRRIGLGDWRPEKSGNYGRFEVESITEI